MISNIKYLTREQSNKIDRILIQEYNIPESELIEKAGERISEFVIELRPKKVIVLFGKGNNGADGLASVKYLKQSGINVIIIPASKEFNNNVQKELDSLAKLKIYPAKDFILEPNTLIIDALLGHNSNGNPKKQYAELILKANTLKKYDTKILSIDIPSGLDPNTGKENTPCIEPDYIITFILPKQGLKNFKNVFLADIEIPKNVYQNLDLDNPNFQDEKIIKIL